MQTAVISPTLLPFQKASLNTAEQKSFCSWIAEKISAFITTIFGYFVRICFFMLGEIKTFGAATIMRSYLYCSSEKSEPFDTTRLNQSKKILMDMGGKDYVVKAQDGLADIHYMLFTYENFHSKVQEKGGWIRDFAASKTDNSHFTEQLYFSPPNKKIKALFPPAVLSESWKEFAKSLAKMDWPKVEIKLLNGETQTVYLLSEDSSEEGPLVPSDACVLNVHTARRSFAMDRKHVSKHLGAGLSTCVYDPRGTWESTGRATEGGYYLDGKAVLESLRQNHGFSIPKIWVTGFCGGTVVVAYLKKEYHQQGINVLLENGFTSFETTIRNQPFPASLIGRWGMEAILSTDPETTQRVEQDYFNTLEKLNSLTPYYGPGGISLISYSNGDSKLAPEDGAKLATAAQRIGKAYTLVKMVPKGKDAHRYGLTEDPLLWGRYLHIIRTGRLC